MTENAGGPDRPPYDPNNKTETATDKNLSIAIVIPLCLTLPSLAKSDSAESAIQIYPPHSATADMTMMEQALHRRATEVAIGPAAVELQGHVRCPA
jgi:hypothetical protein